MMAKKMIAWRMSGRIREMLTELEERFRIPGTSVIELILLLAEEQVSSPGREWHRWHQSAGQAEHHVARRITREGRETAKRLSIRWGITQSEVIEYLIYDYHKHGIIR